MARASKLLHLVPKPRKAPNFTAAEPRNAEVYRCATCGDSACYGVGVRLLHGQSGTWFCERHRPGEVAAEKVA